MKWKQVFLTVLALFTFTVAKAQFYPVQTTTQLIPPYSVYLSDYATGGNEKLRVILLQRDLTQPSYQLRLVMTVELNGQVIMRTSRAYNPAPINLNPGIPTVISGPELAPYVDSRNIDFVGYSRDQYERTKALPEGSYQITFTAYDYRRQDVQVSNAGISFYYLSKNEPPLINFPACSTKVSMRTPQQIIFSWLSRNTASPNSAADTEFELSLYETRPEGRNPNDVVLSTQPVFRITVDLPQYIYSPSDPLLLNGMKYVWRVRAIDKNGKDSFRNNGYSEVCTFTYGGNDPDFDMGVVKNLQAEGETERKGRIWWDLGDYDGYVASYRKTGEGYEWFTSIITKEELTQAAKTQGEVKLFDLEPDTEYETRVQPKKSGFLGAYTDIIKFRTKPHVVAQCGVNPNLPQADLTRPMRSGIKGMLIQVDDIEIQLMDVLHLGDGWYKGTGRTSIPYFGGAVFAVTFDRLYIDENRVAGLGRIDFVTQGVAGLVEQQLANIEKKEQEKAQALLNETNNAVYDITFPGTIESISINNSGEIIVTDAQGVVTTYERKIDTVTGLPKETVVTDNGGTSYVIDKDGKVTKQDSSNSLVDDEDASDDASTDPKFVVSYSRKDYSDEDIIAFTETFTKKITLKALYRNNKNFDKTKVTWIGATGTNNEVEIDMSTVQTSMAITAIYDGKDTINLSLVKYLIEFRRNAGMVYGHDEDSKPEWTSSGQHVSVNSSPGAVTGNATFIDMRCADISRFQIVSSNNAIATADPNFIVSSKKDEYKVRIVAMGQGDVELSVRLTNSTDTTTFAKISVHAYEILDVAGNVYYLQDRRYSTTSFTASTLTDIQDRARSLHKFMVVRPTVTNVTTNNLPYDENGNGKLDYYTASQNGGNEISVLLNNLNVLPGDVFILPDGMQTSYRMTQTVNNTDLIYVEGNTGIKIGADMFIEKPDGTSSTPFKVLSKKVFDTRQVQLQLQSPFKFNRLATDNYKLIDATGVPLISDGHVGDKQIRVRSNMTLKDNVTYVLKGRNGENIETITITAFTLIVDQDYILDLLSPLKYEHLYNPQDVDLGHYIDSPKILSVTNLTINTGDVSLTVPMGSDITKMTLNKNVTFQKANGTDSEIIKITSMTNIGGLAYAIQADQKLYNHPFIPGNLIDSHQVRPASNIAGLEVTGLPVLVSATDASKQNAKYIGYVISHEKGHQLGLVDVDNTDNVMHYNNSGYKDVYKLPFSYTPQKGVLTGTSTPSNINDKQWNKVHGR